MPTMKSSSLESRSAPDKSTVHVPLTLRRRGGRRTMLAPSDRLTVRRFERAAQNPVVLALAKAFRWRRQLESGAYVTVKELAAAESVNESYMSRVLRLTLLAPDIVEALLDSGSEPPGLRLLLAPFPVAWSQQRRDYSAESAWRQMARSRWLGG